MERERGRVRAGRELVLLGGGSFLFLDGAFCAVTALSGSKVKSDFPRFFPFCSCSLYGRTCQNKTVTFPKISSSSCVQRRKEIG